MEKPLKLKRGETPPRRANPDLMTQAELAIVEAMRCVEEAGVGKALSEAAALLLKARDLVSDHVDGVE